MSAEKENHDNGRGRPNDPLSAVMDCYNPWEWGAPGNLPAQDEAAQRSQARAAEDIMRYYNSGTGSNQ